MGEWGNYLGKKWMVHKGGIDKQTNVKGEVVALRDRQIRQD